MERSLLLVTVMLLFCMTGCAHVISDENRARAVSSFSMAEMKEKPQNYAGKFLMLGGLIASVKNGTDGGQIEIVQYPLTGEGYPDESQGSEGRFLASSPSFIDSLVYKKGKLMTLVGEFKGTRTLPLDDVAYTYPMVSIKESHLWQTDDKPAQPYQIPGTNLVDPYYYGHDTPPRTRPEGVLIKPWQ